MQAVRTASTPRSVKSGRAKVRAIRIATPFPASAVFSSERCLCTTKTVYPDVVLLGRCIIIYLLRCIWWSDRYYSFAIPCSHRSPAIVARHIHFVVPWAKFLACRSIYRIWKSSRQNKDRGAFSVDLNWNEPIEVRPISMFLTYLHTVGA